LREYRIIDYEGLKMKKRRIKYHDVPTSRDIIISVVERLYLFSSLLTVGFHHTESANKI